METRKRLALLSALPPRTSEQFLVLKQIRNDLAAADPKYVRACA